jgi:hypothetical protein
MNVINWTNKKHSCHNILLFPILEEIHRLLDTFNNVTISHVYRDINMTTYTLSKEGLQLLQGQWHITKIKEKIQMPSSTGLLQMNMNYHIFELTKHIINRSILFTACSFSQISSININYWHH